MNALVATASPSSVFRNLAPLAAGVVFAVGLGVSGMTQPAKVAGFLDFFGEWDPALLGVMAGGILVNLALHAWIIRRRRAPLFAELFSLPTRRDIDLRLVLGAILFGAGWALGGYCPGPGVVSVVSGSPEALVFFGFMVVGVLAERGARRGAA
jgi:uncharacterized membrane protein YedE/YeeE